LLIKVGGVSGVLSVEANSSDNRKQMEADHVELVLQLNPDVFGLNPLEDLSKLNAGT